MNNVKNTLSTLDEVGIKRSNKSILLDTEFVNLVCSGKKTMVQKVIRNPNFINPDGSLNMNNLSSSKIQKINKELPEVICVNFFAPYVWQIEFETLQQ